MNIGEYIASIIEQQGRTKVWVADQTEINYKTLVDKLKHDRLTAYDLLKLAKVLGIDLNELKNKIDEEEF